MPDCFDIATRWREKKLNNLNDLDIVLNDYRVLFAFHSNRIEGNALSIHQTREIFENGKLINFTGDTREIFEAQNQKYAYEFLKLPIIKNEPMTENLVLETHEALCYGCYDEARWMKGERPGQYKIHFYGTGIDAGLPPEDVESEMKFILDEISEIKSWDGTRDDIKRVLTVASYFHLNFENIHPFADGNGRTGRTLMNYFLMTHGLPPVIVFDEDKELYYECLFVFDKTEKLDAFVSFLQDEMIKTWTRENSAREKKGQKFICL